MRRSLFLTGFVLGAAVLLGALAWISHLTVDLEAREQDARQRAAFEERVRLSLWRMDSAVASLLAQENARPVEPVEPVEPAAAAPPVPREWRGPRVRAGETAAPASTGRTAASGPPPLAEKDRPYLATRFEIGPGGEVREWPISRRGPRQAAAPLERDALLAGLRQGPLVARPEPTSETAEPPHWTGAMAAVPRQAAQRPGTAAPAPLRTEQAPGTAARSEVAQRKAVQLAGASGTLPTVKAPVPKQAAPASEGEPPPLPPRQARPEARSAPATDPVAREMAKQQQLNQTEFEQRLVQNQAFEPQAVEPPTRAGGPSSAEAATGAAAAPSAVVPSAAQIRASSPAATSAATAPSASSPFSVSSPPSASASRHPGRRPARPSRHGSPVRHRRDAGRPAAHDPPRQGARSAPSPRSGSGTT